MAWAREKLEQLLTLREKCSNMELFLVRIFG